MAIKRTTRKTSGGAKMTTSYNTKTGQTRYTHTVKPTKSLTISRSMNRNGSVKTTRTNTINGWMTRKSSTPGTGVVKSKKMRAPKVYSGGSRRRGSSKADGELALALGGIVVGIVLGFFWLVWKYIVLMWQTAELTVKKPETEENLKQVSWRYTKIFCIFVGYIWLTALVVYYGFKALYYLF